MINISRKTLEPLKLRKTLEPLKHAKPMGSSRPLKPHRPLEPLKPHRPSKSGRAVKSLKSEISTKIYLHSSSTSLYRNTYKKFNSIVGPKTLPSDNFVLSQSHFATLAKNWNIKTNARTIDKLYNTIEPNAINIRYNTMVSGLIN